MSLTAGSAVLDITPHSPNHLAGYANRDHPHEGVHDRLSLRALYLSNGTDDLVLVSGDILWFREAVLEPIHRTLEDQLGIPPERAMLCGTHTHSAPTTSGPNTNREYLHFLTAQTLAAVTLAKTRAESITLRLGRGSSKIGVNRREQIADGSVILGENLDGPIDREAILVTLDGSGETPIAEVCSFATHGTVMGGDNYQLSGDWCGIAASELEQKTQTFIYTNGGCADVNPRGRTRPSTFSVAEALAEEFVGDIESTRGSTNALDGDDVLTGAFKLIELPHKQGEIEAGKGRTARIQIHGIRFGPVRIVGFPGEVFGETAMAVKQAYASDVVAVNSYTTG